MGQKTLFHPSYLFPSPHTKKNICGIREICVTNKLFLWDLWDLCDTQKKGLRPHLCGQKPLSQPNQR